MIKMTLYLEFGKIKKIKRNGDKKWIVELDNGKKFNLYNKWLRKKISEGMDVVLNIRKSLKGNLNILSVIRKS